MAERNLGSQPAAVSDAQMRQEKSGESSEESDSVSVVDRLNRTVTFHRAPQRIVSLSPATTELLFALGVHDCIVGATEYCNYPEEAQKIQRIGKGTIEGISREAIVSVKPDLIFCKWDSHQPLIQTFENLGIPIIGIGPESVEELISEAKMIGKIMRCDRSASSFCDRFLSRLSELQASVSTIPQERRVKVFYEVWDEPLMTAGPNSFIGQMLNLANVDNIFHDVVPPYPRVSSEVMVARNPDVILAPTTHGQKVVAEKVGQRAGWGEVNAVKENRIYIIHGDKVSRCGPRMLAALEDILRNVYPALSIPPTEDDLSFPVVGCEPETIAETVSTSHRDLP